MKRLFATMLCIVGYSIATDSSKCYPKPTDVIKIDNKKRAVCHHISLSLIQGAPESLTKAIKYYGIPKNGEYVQRLKSTEEIERFRTTFEGNNYFCYKPHKTLRVFFGANEPSIMYGYYAKKTSSKHFTSPDTSNE